MASMGCVQTNRLEVVFNVQSISVKIGRCSAHKISPKNLRAVTYLFQPLLLKKISNDLSKSKIHPILDIHQKTTRKGGDVLSHLLPKRCASAAVLASLGSILEAHEIENPKKHPRASLQPAFKTSPLLAYRKEFQRC